MDIDKNISTADIQKELSRLSVQSSCEGTKACLFNLIVYTHEPPRTQYFKEVIKMIMMQFPCRIIFIEGNLSSKENHLQVKVTTEKTENGRGIVCDQISIQASSQQINRVYFLLLPLFVPDLPIYLLWGQDPTTEYTILPHLQHFATRLIFDSEATEDLQQFSLDMLNQINSSSIPIVDMNWARISGWREVLAEVFDSPERFEQLASAKNIKIIYNDRLNDLFFRPATQAIYLQAWLSARLGWQFQKAEKNNDAQVLFYQSLQTSRTIQLIPQTHQNFEPEEILGIEIEGSDYECHLQRLSIDQVRVQASNQYQCELPFILLMPTLRSGRSYMQEIFYQEVSAHYVPMLKLISLVKWS